MIIEGIWSGRIIYSAQNARALIADVGTAFLAAYRSYPDDIELQETAYPAI
jgi:hypothetical protein